jgi:galactose mutarotase-like enzyme
VQKHLWRTERHSLRLRVEAFNLTNHPNFAIPTDLSLWTADGRRLPTAGRITRTNTTSRQVQLALRYSF